MLGLATQAGKRRQEKGVGEWTRFTFQTAKHSHFTKYQVDFAGLFDGRVVDQQNGQYVVFYNSTRAQLYATTISINGARDQVRAGSRRLPVRASRHVTTSVHRPTPHLTLTLSLTLLLSQ